MAHRRRPSPRRTDVAGPVSRPGNPRPIVLALCTPLPRTVILKLRRSAVAVTKSRLSTAIVAALLCRPPPCCVALDMVDVAHLDPAAIASVVTWHNACARVGVRLSVHRPSPAVERLLLAGGLSASSIGLPNRAHDPATGAAL